MRQQNSTCGYTGYLQLGIDPLMRSISGDSALVRFLDLEISLLDPTMLGVLVTSTDHQLNLAPIVQDVLVNTFKRLDL